MAEYEKKVRDVLRKNGCYFIRYGKGDHEIWESPISNQRFPVDNRINIRHIANAIMKQSGIKHHF